MMARQRMAGVIYRNSFKLIGKISPLNRARNQAFQSLRQRFYRQFWQYSAEQIGAHIDELQNNWWKITRAGRSTFIHAERVMLDSAVMLELAGDKALVYRLLAEDDYPVPRSLGFDLQSMAQAYAFQRTVSGPVVVKPVDAWAGQGVTVNISTPEELKQAAWHATCFSSKLLVEEHIRGDSYRLLYLNGELIDAIRRDPPQIKGDGRQTIRQLIAAENSRRISDKNIISLNALSIDADCRRTLKSQGMALSQVVPEGKLLAVKTVVNQNNRMENHSVRDQVHPEISDMGSAICGRYQVELAGLDILCDDITRPLAETGGVINEINTTPGLHHHSLVSDYSQIAPVGAQVLDYLLERRHVGIPAQPFDQPLDVSR